MIEFMVEVMQGYHPYVLWIGGVSIISLAGIVVLEMLEVGDDI